MQTCDPGRLRLLDHLWPFNRHPRNLTSLIRQFPPFVMLSHGGSLANRRRRLVLTRPNGSATAARLSGAARGRILDVPVAILVP